MTDLPEYKSLATLDTLETFTADPSRIDERGHMNVRFYFDACARAIFHTGERLGLDGKYREQSGCDGFTSEHHIRYWGEVRQGDSYSTRSLVLAHNDKAFSVMAFVLNDTKEILASTLESTLVHVHLATRRPVSLPRELREKIDTSITGTPIVPRLVPKYGRLSEPASQTQ
jgi:acyl-CoA thioester hydrolase